MKIPRAKTATDVSGVTQMLGELVRKYEEHSDKQYDKDLKLHRFHDVVPKTS